MLTQRPSLVCISISNASCHLTTVVVTSSSTTAIVTPRPTTFPPYILTLPYLNPSSARTINSLSQPRPFQRCLPPRGDGNMAATLPRSDRSTALGIRFLGSFASIVLMPLARHQKQELRITDLQSYVMATDNSVKAQMEALEIRIENWLQETLNNFKKSLSESLIKFQ